MDWVTWVVVICSRYSALTVLCSIGMQNALGKVVYEFHVALLMLNFPFFPICCCCYCPGLGTKSYLLTLQLSFSSFRSFLLLGFVHPVLYFCRLEAPERVITSHVLVSYI